MISFHRTVCVKSGMFVSALGVAKEFVAVVKNVADLEVRLELPIGGNPWRIRWAVNYSDLTAMEASNKKLMASADYQALLVKIGDYLVSGAGVDEIWNVV